MLPALLMLQVIAVVVGAEQVPCKTGQNSCTGFSSLSVVNNNYFCCDTGFNMQWKNEVTNDTSVANCVCNRHFYESECIEGQLECQGAFSLMSDGVTVRCCKNGDSMNSVSNSFVNGVKVDYCKCIRYMNNGAGGGFINVGRGIRPMTDSERLQFTATMNQFSQELQNSMNQMTRTLSENLGLLNLDFGQNLARQIRPAGLGHWADNFLEGLGQTLRQSFSQAFRLPGLSNFQPRNITSATGARNSASTGPFTTPRPSPMWDVRQRRFQQLQRRLQQRQQRRNSPAFLNRLNRNPVLAQVMSPSWWMGQNWRGMFGAGGNRRNNTTEYASNSNSTNDGDRGAANPYSSLPNQNDITL